MKRLARWGWSLALLLLLPLPALAADEQKQDAATSGGEGIPHHRLLEDRFRVRLGGYYSQSTTDARFATEKGGVGVDVNFEDLLGISSRKWVGEASMYWRFASHWRLDVDYFAINRNGTRNLGKDVTWGDNVYGVGTTVQTTTRISDLRAVVGYSFFKRPDKELGIGIGLHSTGVSLGLDASGVGAASSNATAPLPVASLYSNFALTDTWALSFRADWLSLTYDKYSGAIRSTAVDFVYQPFTHFAFGFGLHNLLLNVDIHNTDSQANVHFVTHGPAAFVAYSY